MKIQYGLLIRFWHRRLIPLAAIPLILFFFLFPGVCFSSGGTYPQSITILYTNNINGEIDPCPT